VLPYTVNEDDVVVLSGLDVFDVDSNSLTIVASAKNGLLSISRRNETDLILLANSSGHKDKILAFSASPESTRRVMSTMLYRPEKDFNTLNRVPDIISLEVTDDQGSVVRAHLPVVVLPVNDSPRIDVPGANWTYAEDDLYNVESVNTIEVLEDTTLRIPGISIIDPDSNAVLMSVTSSHGSVSFINTSGVSFRLGSGQRDSHVEIFAPSVDILNEVVSSISYLPNNGYFGNDTIRIIVSDFGNEDESFSEEAGEVQCVELYVPIFSLAHFHSLTHSLTYLPTHSQIQC